MLRALLRCLVPGNDAGLDPRADLGRFYDQHVILLARSHRLSALLGALQRAGVSRGLAELFRRDHVATVARNMMLHRALADCLRALSQQGIDAIVLKGMEYEQRLYGRIGARPTSDLDILIEDRHRRAAFDVLQATGWSAVAAAPGFHEADYHA